MTLACAVLVRRGRVLLERRPPGGLFAGLLGLPSAEVPPGAAPRAALAAALEAAGLRARVGEELGAVRRQLTHRTLQLVAYACTASGGPARAGRWVPWSHMEQAGLPAAMRALLGSLERGRGTGDTRGGRASLRKSTRGPRDPLAFSRGLV